MSYAKKENRRHARHDYPLTIEYVLEPPTNAGVIHKGVTIDISTAGLGAYVLEPLSIGQKVVIKTSLPVDHQTAEVRWIKEKNSSFYSTGLKFL